MNKSNTSNIPHVIIEDMKKFYNYGNKKTLIELNKEEWSRFPLESRKIIIYAKNKKYPIFAIKNLETNKYEITDKKTVITHVSPTKIGNTFINFYQSKIDQREIANLSKSDSDLTILIANIIINANINLIKTPLKDNLSGIKYHLTNIWFNDDSKSNKEIKFLKDIQNLSENEIEKLDIIARHITTKECLSIIKQIHHKTINKHFSDLSKTIATHYFTNLNIKLSTIIKAKTTILQIEKELNKKFCWSEDFELINFYGHYLQTYETFKDIIKIKPNLFKININIKSNSYFNPYGYINENTYKIIAFSNYLKYLQTNNITIPESVTNDIFYHSNTSLKNLNKQGWGRFETNWNDDRTNEDYELFSPFNSKYLIYGKKNEYPIIIKIQKLKKTFQDNTAKLNPLSYKISSPNNININDFTHHNNLLNDKNFILNQYKTTNINIIDCNKNDIFNSISTVQNILYHCIVPIEQSSKIKLYFTSKQLTMQWLKGDISKEKEKISLTKFLNIKKGELKYLKFIEKDNYISFLNNEIDNLETIIKIFSKEFSNIDKFLAIHYHFNEKIPIDTLIKAKTTIHSLCNHCIKKEYTNFYQDNIINEYADYMEMYTRNKNLITELNYPFSLRIKPSHIHNEHNNLCKFLNTIRQKERNKKYNNAIKQFKEENSKTFEYYENEYTVILPKDADNIVDEGMILNHCVGTSGYIERMANNQTVIAFLRKSNNIDKPFFTMEINHGKINQCFTHHDSFNKDIKVKAFIERYAKNKGLTVNTNIG